MYLKSSLLCFLALAPNANANWFSLRGNKNKDSVISSNEGNPTARITEEENVPEVEGITEEEEAVLHLEEVKNKQIYEGAAIMCEGDEREVHRWTDGELRHYLDPGTAAAWDNPKWRKHVMFINCEGMRHGPPIRSEGQAIMCIGIEDKVFRFNNDGLLHHYINPPVAEKFDPNWRDNVMRFDCSDFDLHFGNIIE